MNNSARFFLIGCFLQTLLSCSPSSKLAHRLNGDWNIAAYKETNLNGHNMSATNIGTMHFYKDGTGEKRINYSILQNNYSNQKTFTWSNTATAVTLHGDSSVFAKTWIVIANKRRFQNWKTTDGRGNVREMILKKN